MGVGGLVTGQANLRGRRLRDTNGTTLATATELSANHSGQCSATLCGRSRWANPVKCRCKKRTMSSASMPNSSPASALSSRHWSMAALMASSRTAGVTSSKRGACAAGY